MLDAAVNHLQKIFTFSNVLPFDAFVRVRELNCREIIEKWPRFRLGFKTHLPTGAKGFSVPVHSHEGEAAFWVKVAAEAMENPILEETF